MSANVYWRTWVDFVEIAAVMVAGAAAIAGIIIIGVTVVAALMERMI